MSVHKYTGVILDCVIQGLHDKHHVRDSKRLCTSPLALNPSTLYQCLAAQGQSGVEEAVHVECPATSALFGAVFSSVESVSGGQQAESGRHFPETRAVCPSCGR